MSEQQNKQQQQTQQNIQPAIINTHMIANMVANTIVFCPLERAIRLLQTQSIQKEVGQGDGQEYNGTTDCILKVSQQQGINSLWRSVPLTLTKQLASPVLHKSIQTAVNLVKPVFDPQEQKGKHILTTILNGISVGTLTVLLIYPIDILKIKTETDPKCQGLTKHIKEVYKNNKLAGFYAGFGTSVLQVIAHRFFFMGISKPFSKILNNTQSSFVKLLINALMVTFAGLMTYPIDTVRSRLALQTGKNQIYNGPIDCASKIYKGEGGIKGFFKGASGAVTKIVGSLILTFVLEMAQKSLEKKAKK